MPSPYLQEALLLHQTGISVLPIRPATSEGDKRPAVAWKRLQEERASEEEIRTWFDTDQYGLGIICGKVSGNLVMVEIEGAAGMRLADITATARTLHLDTLWERVHSGWFEATPKGGFHFYIRTDTPSGKGNQKLAQRAISPTERLTLAETREEGGYTVIAPTDGRFHADGKPWIRLRGGPATIPTISLAEYDDLLALFRIIDEMPHAAQDTTLHARQAAPQLPTDPHAGISPGDDFEARTSWAEILTPHGWTPVREQGNETLWCRPGKTFGISASTGASPDRDRLYVWSTSTIFDSERPYTKFGAYSLLNHGGDHSQAAKALADKGYGRQAEHTRDTVGLDSFLSSHQASTQPAAEPASDVAAPSALAALEEPEIFTRTDDGNALRFADAYHGSLRWIPETRAWASWNGHKWDAQNGNAVAAELAKQLIRNLPEDDKADQTHKTRSLSRAGIVNMLALAQTSQRLYAPMALFDQDANLLNTPSGPVDLRTGRTLLPDPALHCLRSTTIAPDPGMPTPRWNRFLAQTFTNNAHLITYVQRLLGVALIGRVHEQLLPFFHGAGANGKSTLLNVTQAILGIGAAGYSTTVPADIFLTSASTRHPTDIASLAGVRVAVTSETEEGQRFGEARVKLLTGSDNISARFMRGDFFTFTPTHTIFLVSNHAPEVASGGTAFWRRIRKIPFDNIVPADQRDPHLEEKLLAEGPGILAWLIQGARDYLKAGMEEPAEVRIATEEYELDQDSIAQFVGEQCVLGDPNVAGMQTLVATFRSGYEAWCRENGLEAFPAKTLSQRLKKHGVGVVRRTKGARYYTGIRLRPEWSDDGIEYPFSGLLGGSY